MKDILFVKYSNERKKEFQIVTMIMEENGKKYVRKKALKEEGKFHINNMYINSQLLQKQINKNSKVIVNKCNKINSYEIEFEYIEGKSVEQVWNECIDEKNIKKLYGQISKFVELFKEIGKSNYFKADKKFIEIFGDVNLSSDLVAYNLSNIDIIPSNIIINDYINIIDYEWTFSFSVPINFILFRSIYLYRKLNILENKVKEKIYYELLGITKEEKIIYEKMEENFQRYVSERKNSLTELYYNMPIKNYILEQINTKDMYIQYKLYYIIDKKEIIILNSVINNYNITLEIDVNKYKDIQQFIFHPVDSSCILKLNYIQGIRENKIEEVVCLNSNEKIKVYDDYYFDISTPTINLENNQYDKIKISYKVFNKNNQQVQQVVNLMKTNEKLTIELNSLKCLLKRLYNIIIKKIKRGRK